MRWLLGAAALAVHVSCGWSMPTGTRTPSHQEAYKENCYWAATRRCYTWAVSDSGIIWDDDADQMCDTEVLECLREVVRAWRRDLSPWLCYARDSSNDDRGSYELAYEDYEDWADYPTSGDWDDDDLR